MASTIQVTETTITIKGVKKYSDGTLNKNCLVKVVRTIDNFLVGSETTNEEGFYKIAIAKNSMSTSVYEIRYYGSGYPALLEPEGDWESFEYSNPTDFITAEQTDQIYALRDWATTISWCSRAILETYLDDSEIDVGASDAYDLSSGVLLISGTAAPSTAYVYYSKEYDIASIAGQSTDSGQYSFYASTIQQGSGNIKIEVSINSGDWWPWLDTSRAAAGDQVSLNSYLDRSATEYTAGDVDSVTGYTLASGISFQVRTTITTDGDGFGGYVDYHAFLADPDLYEA